MTRFEPVSVTLERAIVDEQGELVGWASQFLIEPDEGRIAYVRITLADIPDLSGRTVVIPWSAIYMGNGSSRGWRVSVRKSLLGQLAARQGVRDSGSEANTAKGEDIQ